MFYIYILVLSWVVLIFGCGLCLLVSYLLVETVFKLCWGSTTVQFKQRLCELWDHNNYSIQNLKCGSKKITKVVLKRDRVLLKIHV